MVVTAGYTYSCTKCGRGIITTGDVASYKEYQICWKCLHEVFPNEALTIPYESEED